MASRRDPSSTSPTNTALGLRVGGMWRRCGSPGTDPAWLIPGVRPGVGVGVVYGSVSMVVLLPGSSCARELGAETVEYLVGGVVAALLALFHLPRTQSRVGTNLRAVVTLVGVDGLANPERSAWDLEVVLMT